MTASNRKTIFDAVGRHPIHPFPARMAPGIALDALANSKRKLRVLDPMMGSGTVLAVARAQGHRAFGMDLDPLAVLLSRVWTTPVKPERVSKVAAEVLMRARSLFEITPVSWAYPRNSDKETRRFIRYWFDDYSRRQLAALAVVIGRVRDEQVRNVLWCAFSRLIITKSVGASLAMDLSHSRPHRSYCRAPAKPFRKFISAVNNVVANCPALGTRAIGPATRTSLGDARALKIASKSIDLVVTSPPYLNAIDYMRCSKFSLVWMGYTIREIRMIRGSCIGAETAPTDSGCPTVDKIIGQLGLGKKLSLRSKAILSRYISDMDRALAETARVLKTRGRAIYVVGDSKMHGVFIANSAIVAALAEHKGLRLRSRRSRRLPANRRYLPPPRHGRRATLDARMRREVVLVFQK